MKTDFGYQRGKVMGKMDWELGISIYTLLYIKWVINRDLLYSPGNFARQSVIIYREKNLKKNVYIYIYIYI